MMEVTHSGKLRSWLTTCPSCRSEIKYTKADVKRVKSRTPVNVLIAPEVMIDNITCPDCGQVIQVYYNNPAE